MKIVLIRHGKPSAAHNPKLNAAEYTDWVRQYNFSEVSPESRPIHIDAHYQSFYALSSDLPRAIHSSEIYTGKSPQQINRLYREMDIPRYKIPLKLRAWTWVYLSRLLWILGIKGRFETFKDAKQRANEAASQLVKIAEKENNVVLFGHGVMNRYIRKALIEKGWHLENKSNDYWGVTSLVTVK